MDLNHKVEITKPENFMVEARRSPGRRLQSEIKRDWGIRVVYELRLSAVQSGILTLSSG